MHAPLAGIIREIMHEIILNQAQIVNIYSKLDVHKLQFCQPRGIHLLHNNFIGTGRTSKK